MFLEGSFNNRVRCTPMSDGRNKEYIHVCFLRGLYNRVRCTPMSDGRNKEYIHVCFLRGLYNRVRCTRNEYMDAS